MKNEQKFNSCNTKKHDPRKTGITNAIMVSCKTKKIMYTIWKKKPYNLTLERKFKEYCKVLDKVIKSAKNMLDNESAAMYSNSPKNLYYFINKKIGRNERGKIQKITKKLKIFLIEDYEI